MPCRVGEWSSLTLDAAPINASACRPAVFNCRARRPRVNTAATRWRGRMGLVRKSSPPAGQRLEARFGVLIAGQEHHRGAGGFRLGAQRSNQRQAVHPGHVQVHQHDFGMEIDEGRQCSLRISVQTGFDTRMAQHAFAEHRLAAIVVDNHGAQRRVVTVAQQARDALGQRGGVVVEFEHHVGATVQRVHPLLQRVFTQQCDEQRSCGATRKVQRRAFQAMQLRQLRLIDQHHVRAVLRRTLQRIVGIRARDHRDLALGQPQAQFRDEIGIPADAQQPGQFRRARRDVPDGLRGFGRGFAAERAAHALHVRALRGVRAATVLDERAQIDRQLDRRGSQFRIAGAIRGGGGAIQIIVQCRDLGQRPAAFQHRLELARPLGAPRAHCMRVLRGRIVRPSVAFHGDPC